MNDMLTCALSRIKTLSGALSVIVPLGVFGAVVGDEQDANPNANMTAEARQKTFMMTTTAVEVYRAMGIEM